MAVHTNSYAKNDYSSHADWNGSYNQGTGYHDSGSSTWYWDYSEYNKTDSWSYVNNYYQSANTFDYSPTLSGSFVSPSQPVYNVNILNIDWSTVSFSETVTAYKLYYNRGTKDEASGEITWGDWTLLTTIANASTKTFDWDISSLGAGFYKIAIAAKDAYTYSAALNSGDTATTGSTFVAHCIEKGNSGYVSTADTISVVYSPQFAIYTYTPPTWLDKYAFTPEGTAYIQSEVNRARSAVGLEPYVYVSTDHIANFTKVDTKVTEELHNSSNEIYKYVKGADYPFSKTVDDTSAEKERIEKSDVKEVFDVLNKL